MLVFSMSNALLIMCACSIKVHGGLLQCISIGFANLDHSVSKERTGETDPYCSCEDFIQMNSLEKIGLNVQRLRLIVDSDASNFCVSSLKAFTC